MNSMILSLLIAAQVVVFQFVAVVFTKSVFAVGLGEPPEELARRMSEYQRRVSRQRYALGGVLLVLAVAVQWIVPSGDGAAKLMLTALSLTSTAAFVAAVVQDRKTMRRAHAELPDGGTRRASLTPRKPGYWYNPYWELVPIAMVSVTCAYVYSLTLQLEAVPSMAWLWLGLQAVIAFGGLWYAARRGLRVPNISRRIAMFRRRPELALQFGERLAANEARYFMVVKVLVALLFGLKVVRSGMEALNNPAVATVDVLKWISVGLMLLAYAGFIWRLGRITKRAMSKVEGGVRT